MSDKRRKQMTTRYQIQTLNNVKRTEGHKTPYWKLQRPTEEQTVEKIKGKDIQRDNHKVRDAREKTAEDLVGEVENAKDDTRMFKAVKPLHMKHQKIQFVHDNQKRYVSRLQEIQKIIEQHFMKHFNKKNINHIKKFIAGAKILNRKKTAKEVKAAI